VLSAILTNFLQWYEDCQVSSSTASVSHTSNSFVSLSHSSFLGPWVLGSRVIDHIIGNKSLFSSFSTFNYLPFVTMVNGSQTKSQGLRTVHSFSSIFVDHVLYIFGSPFNLLSISYLTYSIDCVISFT